MSFRYSGATAAQSALRLLRRAGIPAQLRKGFHPDLGCHYLLTVPARYVPAARRILGEGET